MADRPFADRRRTAIDVNGAEIRKGPPLATGAEGAAAAATLIWLRIPWMLAGWTVKRVSAGWTAKMRGPESGHRDLT